MNRQRLTVLLILLILLLGVGAAFIVQRWNEYTQRFRTGQPIPQFILPDSLLDESQIIPSGTPSLPPIRAEDPLLYGSPSGTISVIVFGDFECPFCREQAQAVRDAVNQLGLIKTRQLRVVWRDLPLVNQHPRALAAAVAATCAGQQGQFRAMHDALFFEATQLSENEFLAFATKLNLNTTTFLTCMRDPAVPFRIQRDLEIARENAIVSVPLLFIDGVPYDAIRDGNTLAAILDRRLAP